MSKRLPGGILGLFLPVPRGDKSDFNESFTSDILNKSCAVHVLALFIHVFSVFSILGTVIGGHKAVFAALDWAYFYTLLAAILISSFVVFAVLRYGKTKARSRLLGNLVFCASITLMLVIGLLASYEFYVSAQYLHYVLFCILFSLLVNYSPVTGSLILFPGYIAFLVSDTLLAVKSPQAYTELNPSVIEALNSSPVWGYIAGYVTLCVFIFAVNYKRNYMDFLSKRELDELSRHLNNANEQLRAVSVIDTLTKMNNRYALDEYIADVWPKCQSDNAVISIMMVDIDFFKSYNDNFGHQAGDEAISRIADVIKQNFSRMGGMLARYGGDEVIAVIPYVEEFSVRFIAESIRSQVQALGIANPVDMDKHNVLTVSIGVVITNAISIESIKNCIRAADKALYRAKTQGRNTVVIDTPGKG